MRAVLAVALIIGLTGPSLAQVEAWHLSAFFDTDWGRRHHLKPRHVVETFIREAQLMTNCGIDLKSLRDAGPTGQQCRCGLKDKRCGNG